MLKAAEFCSQHSILDILLAFPEEAPVIQGGEQTRTVFTEIGGGIVLECQVRAAPKAIVTWYYNEYVLYTILRILASYDAKIRPR